MSADTDGRGRDSPNAPVEITLSLGENGDLWMARDEETGVASQGETREAALENLDEAVALYRGDVGRAPTDEEVVAVGIEPDANASGDLPDVLK
ncbi:type II toxin-antitoxin system HicB family antitoxin [Halobacterium noricense]|uniref:type II toxin-antitoxin system HicB family antitoxin n=1 Tax=Halobacterium noricense TaxID=223182 RepID=UPI001E3FBFE0|nr:type II toxin-antitoxin system HicB family antitoxin [Halobacterium noricense]UHH25559.1 type II toxin-antitoxin system HicB family antitoxin [Halobacterium noricense]